MKKISILLTMVLSVMMAHAAVLTLTTGITREYSSIESLEGVTFAIVNKDEGKALFGTYNQNLAYDVYSIAFSNANSGYMWRLVSFADDADEEVRDYYRFQLVTPSGDDYYIWGGGCLNSQAATGDCSFILGLNGQNGQDIKNGAVYDVEYVEGLGFSIRNIGTGLYQGANIGAANAEEPTYFTFVEVARTYVPALKELLAEGAALREVVTDANAVAAYDAAVARINPDAVAGDGYEEAKMVDAAIVALTKALPASVGQDFTRAIVNPSFEYGSIEGWTSNNGGNSINNGSFGAVTGAFFVERWVSSNSTVSDGSFMQTITGLPNGVYRLTAEMQNREQGNDDAAGTGLFLFANGHMAEAVTNNGETIAVESSVTNGTLKIGAVLQNCSGNWICFDNFQLTFLNAIATEPNQTPEIGEDMTSYIVNAGFDEGLTWNADGSKKGDAVRNTILSNRSIAYVTEDGSLYATVNPNTSAIRPDGRTFDATNGFIGQIDGWDAEKRDGDQCEWMYFGTVPYDLETEAIPVSDDGSSYLTAPERSTNFDGGTGALYMRAGWGGSFSYRQEVTLPCAKYRLEYWTINVNPNTESMATDLSRVICMHETFAEESGSALTSMEWTKHSFEFTPLTTFTLEFGMQVSNASSGRTPWVCIDGIKLYKIAEADSKSIAINELYYYLDELDSYMSIYEDYAGLMEEINKVKAEIEVAISTDDLDTMNTLITKIEKGIQTWNVLVNEFVEKKEVVEKLLMNYELADVDTFYSTLESIVARVVNADSEEVLSLTEELASMIRQIEVALTDPKILIEQFGVDGKTLVKNEPVYLYNMKAGQFIASGAHSYRNDLAVFCNDRLPLCFELVDTVQLAANGRIYEGIAIMSYENPYTGVAPRPTQLGMQVNTSHIFLRYHDTANLLIPVFILGKSETGYFTLTTESKQNVAYVGYNPNQYSPEYNSTIISCNVGLSYDGSTDWAIIPAKNAEAYIETIKNRIARSDLQTTYDEKVYPYYNDLESMGMVSNEFMMAMRIANAALVNEESTTDELNTAEKALMIAMNHAKFSTIEATEKNPVDVTEIAIENAAFDKGSTTGWMIDGINSAQNMGYQSASYYSEDATVSNFIEAWQSASAGTLSDGAIYQTLWGLPAGKYILQADAIVGNFMGNDYFEGVNLYMQDEANIATAAISTGDDLPHAYSLSFVHDGSNETGIGIQLVNATTNWIAADNFRLIYYGTGENHNPEIGEDMTPYIINAGFDEDLTWLADGSKKGEAVRTETLSKRSIAYVTEDGSLYATVNPNTPSYRMDGRTYDATNGFIGQIQGWTVETDCVEDMCEWIYFGAVPYDLAEEAIPVADDGTTYLSVPERPNGNPDNNAFLYLRAGWGAAGSYKQTVNLPTAKYRLDYMAYLGNDNTVDASSVSFRGRVQAPDVQDAMIGEWANCSVEFIANGDFTIQFGVSSNYSLSNRNPILWIDNVALTKIADVTEKDVYIDDINYYMDASLAIIEDYENRYPYTTMETIYASYNEKENMVYGNDLQNYDERLLNVVLDDVKNFYAWLSDESNFDGNTTLLGDANCDGSVDIVDVTTIVDFILERSYPTSEQWTNSDVNGDGSIDIVDLTSTVQIILGTYNNAVVYSAKARTAVYDALTVEDTDISLENSRDYVGFQMDVTVSDGAQFRGVQLSDRGEDHSVAYRRIGDNTYRIVAYSVAGTAFSGNGGNLLTLDLNDGSVQSISNAVFTDGMKGYTLMAGGGTTGIKAVNSDAVNVKDCFDLTGRRVNHIKKGGVYIVKGEKVWIK